MDTPPIDVRDVAPEELLHVAADLCGGFQVSGFAGAGYSLLTDAYGEAIFIGHDVEAWRSPSLFVMRQTLTAAAARALERWGVASPEDLVGGLPFGGAVLLQRGR